MLGLLSEMTAGISLPTKIEAAGEGSLLFAITARPEGRRSVLLMAMKLVFVKENGCRSA